ncbi:MAG: hypothetical protein NVS3B26_13950 [Mycobacteriales bacterium]
MVDWLMTQFPDAPTDRVLEREASMVGTQVDAHGAQCVPPACPGLPMTAIQIAILDATVLLGGL